LDPYYLEHPEGQLVQEDLGNLEHLEHPVLPEDLLGLYYLVHLERLEDQQDLSHLGNPEHPGLLVDL
jgi:hypothetical protein